MQQLVCVLQSQFFYHSMIVKEKILYSKFSPFDGLSATENSNFEDEPNFTWQLR